MKNLFLLFALVLFSHMVLSFARQRRTEIKPASVDTVKKPAPVIKAPEKQMFVLVGSEDDFKAIIKILDDPEPSHRDVQTLRNWILKNTRPVSMSDSTKPKTP